MRGHTSFALNVVQEKVNLSLVSSRFLAKPKIIKNLNILDKFLNIHKLSYNCHVCGPLTQMPPPVVGFRGRLVRSRTAYLQSCWNESIEAIFLLALFFF